MVRQRKSCSSSSALGFLETVHLATLGVDARHDVLDGAVLARGVHGLEDDQQGVAPGGVKKILQPGHFADVFGQRLLVIFFGLVKGFDPGGPAFEFDARAGRNAKGLGGNVHGLLLPLGPRGRNLFWLAANPSGGLLWVFWISP